MNPYKLGLKGQGFLIRFLHYNSGAATWTYFQSKLCSDSCRLYNVVQAEQRRPKKAGEM